jgi:hypothetical protein
MFVATLVLSVVATAAAVLSGVVAAVALRSSRATRKEAERQAKNLNKRDLFLALHEKLCAPDQLWGRRVLREQINSLEDAERLRASGHPDGQAAAGALAMLDILSLYVDREYVEKELVLDEWGHVLADLKDSAAIFMRNRMMPNGRRPWRHYQDFVEKAVAWARDRPY